ncbi:MAG TPA: DUF996 domain-containing protein, partial [Candidatus Bathyarchaeia archaeon]|nr:DUF996 domain-containing protein [Candidatus Bathyarchaeia archaeon]
MSNASNVESSKTLAGLGSILLILTPIPYAGVVLGIIGAILLLIGIKGLASYYQDNGIYENAVMGVVFLIIAVIAFAVAIAALAIGFATIIGFGLGILAFLAGLVIAFFFYLVAAMRLRKTFDTLAQKSGEQSFTTAGTLLWWGAILTIVLVGFILIFLAWIFATVGFFSMKAQQHQPYSSQPYVSPPPSVHPIASPTATPTTMARYCPNC